VSEITLHLSEGKCPIWPDHKLMPNTGCVALLVARLPLLLPVGPYDPGSGPPPYNVRGKTYAQQPFEWRAAPARTDSATCASRGCRPVARLWISSAVPTPEKMNDARTQT
jgi:hypothetical protein